MNTRPHLIPALAAAVLLLVALGHHPYGYYTFLRWAVCIAAATVAWAASASTLPVLLWPFVGIAVLFNPISPVYLQRSIWRPIDILCTLAFLGSLALERGAGQAAELGR